MQIIIFYVAYSDQHMTEEEQLQAALEASMKVQ